MMYVTIEEGRENAIYVNRFILNSSRETKTVSVHISFQVYLCLYGNNPAKLLDL